jgi:ABC-type polysaccharide/polyol phosphate transport system ATPase subunit
VAEFSAVSKSYPVYARPVDRLRELVTFNSSNTTLASGRCAISTSTSTGGETFCVIGENGAGKSTLLQILAGILASTLPYGARHRQSRCSANPSDVSYPLPHNTKASKR